jgi:hypothetical protein
MCIRAFDYLPPTDVTFGAFLRALVTADWELNSLDEVGLRAAIIEACRRRGIFAVEAGSLAVNALLLDVASSSEWRKYETVFQQWVDLAIRSDIEQQRADTPDDGADVGFVEVNTFRSFAQQAPPVRSEAYESEDQLESASQLRIAIQKWFGELIPDERKRLGLLPGADLKTPHFHSSRRVTSDGTVRFGLIVQLIQMQVVGVGGASREFPWGVTLVIDVTGRVRFVIGASEVGSRKPEMEQMAKLAMTSPMGWMLNDPSTDPFAVDYRGMHEARV